MLSAGSIDETRQLFLKKYVAISLKIKASMFRLVWELINRRTEINNNDDETVSQTLRSFYLLWRRWTSRLQKVNEPIFLLAGALIDWTIASVQAASKATKMNKGALDSRNLSKNGNLWYTAKLWFSAMCDPCHTRSFLEGCQLRVPCNFWKPPESSVEFVVHVYF